MVKENIVVQLITHHSSTVLDTTKFELYQDGVDYKGDWTTSTYYKVNDVVKFGGLQYKCTTAQLQAVQFR